LDNNRHIGLEHGGVIASKRYRLRIHQVIEAKVLHSPPGDLNAIGANRFAIRVVDNDLNPGLLLSRVED
jgi:hypothetical protein